MSDDFKTLNANLTATMKPFVDAARAIQKLPEYIAYVDARKKLEENITDTLARGADTAPDPLKELLKEFGEHREKSTKLKKLYSVTHGVFVKRLNEEFSPENVVAIMLFLEKESEMRKELRLGGQQPQR